MNLYNAIMRSSIYKNINKIVNDDVLSLIGQPNGITPLGPNGQIPAKFLPNNTSRYYQVQTEADMLAFTQADIGDYVYIISTNLLYFLLFEPVSDINNWRLISQPYAVTAFNGRPGPVIMPEAGDYNTDMVPEGEKPDRRYWTDERFESSVNARLNEPNGILGLDENKVATAGDFNITGVGSVKNYMSQAAFNSRFDASLNAKKNIEITGKFTSTGDGGGFLAPYGSVAMLKVVGSSAAILSHNKAAIGIGRALKPVQEVANSGDVYILHRMVFGDGNTGWGFEPVYNNTGFIGNENKRYIIGAFANLFATGIILGAGTTATATAGGLKFDSALKKPQYHDGTSWQDFGSAAYTDAQARTAMQGDKIGINTSSAPLCSLQVNPKPSSIPTLPFLYETASLITAAKPNITDGTLAGMQDIQTMAVSGVNGQKWANIARTKLGAYKLENSIARTKLAYHLSDNLGAEIENTPEQFAIYSEGAISQAIAQSEPADTMIANGSGAFYTTQNSLYIKQKSKAGVVSKLNLTGIPVSVGEPVMPASGAAVFTNPENAWSYIKVPTTRGPQIFSLGGLIAIDNTAFNPLREGEARLQVNLIDGRYYGSIVYQPPGSIVTRSFSLGSVAA